ncbi:MAG TPA: hypothetical protein VFU12_11180 [Glycomyces sp.]|nr:hypothetical protein [Glycomyces sp.]
MPRFHMEPEEVRTAAAAMRESAQTLRERMSLVAEEAARLPGGFTGTAAVAAMTEAWSGTHLPAHQETFETLAGHLDVHADEVAEADERSAEEFDAHRR